MSLSVLTEAEPESFPFFSQLNFKIAAERLENSSFRVWLQQVPVEHGDR